MYQKLIVILFYSLVLLGCSKEEVSVKPPDVDESYKIYEEGLNAMKRNEFFFAAKKFSEAEKILPQIDHAAKALLMSGFCYYKSNMYNDSLDALERFIALYPGSSKISYAYYLRALNYFEQVNDVERDQVTTSKAKKAFKELINKFPKSEFAIDALTRIDILDDRLAAKEMEIGRFYQFDHQWISAINRYNVVLNEYKTSIYTEEALHRLVEIYYSLGLHEEAKRYAATLQFNFPGSDWYIKSYELVKDLS